jgi:hypothetical protein
MTHLLTKSEYILYLKHPAWLWLKINDKTKLPPVSDSTQAMFDAGHNFEQYAESFFTDNARLGFSDYKSYLTLPTRTSEAIEHGAKNIFQGRFESGVCTFICDVLTINGKMSVDLCEIKSGTHVKEDHIYDLAFQMVVLERCGYTVGKVEVAHVNNEYVRHGEINPKEIVAFEDVTEQVNGMRNTTLANIEGALEVVNSKAHPDFSPSLCGLGSLKEWLSIYKTIEDLEEGCVYDLCRLTPEQTGIFEARGIKRIHDIPSDIELNKFQQRQVDAVKSNEVHIEPDKISSILNNYQYPLYFFDYETFSTCVPEFDGMHPYDQIPFQYSLHIIDEPGSELRHIEFLHDSSSNPVRAICESLKTNIGSGGSVIAWYAVFEKARNTQLGELVPEYKEFFEDLNSRIVDLMDPFKAGYYVHKDFKGSSSIKNVLPVLIPELSYKELEIHEGSSASRLWMDAVLYEKAGFNKAKILKDLKEYCKLDTLAMVRIYEFLKNSN